MQIDREGTYTSRCNSDFVASGPAAESLFGHRFCGPYESPIIDGSSRGYPNHLLNRQRKSGGKQP